MKTILKWPGGKERELPVIRTCTPQYSGRYVEPFVGGGAVFFDIENPKCYINDLSSELMNLYTCIKEKNEDLIKYLELEWNEFSSIGTLVDNNKKEILDLYYGRITIDSFLDKFSNFFSGIADNHAVFKKELIKNLSKKIVRSHQLEETNGNIPESDRLDNIESALKSAYYMYIRYLLNNSKDLSKGRQAAVFFFIREYTYSSMFRYNAKGEFNVPYGGISYNRKDFNKKIQYMFSDEIQQKLATAELYCEDFETFIDRLELNENDFMFLDPPYDSDFSTYAQNVFGPEEQVRLCECLKKTKAKFVFIIKNTELIYNLYKDDFKISTFDKKYLVSFMNRNDKAATHLVITNF